MLYLIKFIFSLYIFQIFADNNEKKSIKDSILFIVYTIVDYYCRTYLLIT